jgi:lipid-binding SYLF domain-containing protein
MLEMGGGSVGLQIGASAVDVAMLVMDRKGMDSMLKDKFTLGGDASVAGGPVGRATTAETDAAMKAKVLSYSRSRGAFAGLELKPAQNQDNNANKALHGREIDAVEILGGKVATPAAAKPVVDVLMKYSPKESRADNERITRISAAATMWVSENPLPAAAMTPVGALRFPAHRQNVATNPYDAKP